MEMRDKDRAKTAAETGIKAAERAVALNASVAEHHRVLGTLCGQVIPANIMAGLKYGRCAQESINKAIELAPKSAMAYISRGVGNYYLPPMFGGGPDVAIRDFRKAIELDPKAAEAYLWMGIALRKANRNAEAQTAILKAVELNPRRVWAKQQLEKTPAK
jgi:tetratricopeptide (TPR) repeat protein